MASMKALAVIPVATGVIPAELLELKHKRDEPFRTFSARVRGKAETCGYITKMECQCGTSNNVDYSDNIVRDVLVAGIYDTDIRREIMGVESIIERPVNEVVSLVDKREMARDANSYTSNVSVVSSYRQEMKKVPTPLSLYLLVFLNPVLATGRHVYLANLVGSNFQPSRRVHRVGIPNHLSTVNCFRSKRQQFRKGQGSASKPSVQHHQSR